FYFIFCFFFQAEDGIRDLTVTGVQTCALPISEGDAGSVRILAPEEVQDDRRRNRNEQQRREFERRIARATERGAGLALDRAIVAGRLDRGRAMIVLAIRDALTALQR